MAAKSFITKEIVIFTMVLVAVLGTCGAREFRVAWMAPGNGTGRHVTSYSSVNALKLGLNSVAANTNIMSGHTISVKYYSTDCSAQQTMSTALQAQQTYNPDVIIGPPCTEGLRTVSQLAAYWNLPVLSWHVTDPQFDDITTYPTLVRMKPSLTIMGESLSHVFRKLGWQSFVLLHGSMEPWTEYVAAVRAAMDKTSIRMFAKHRMNATVSHNSLVSLFGQIKLDTKVIVFACSPADVRQYMVAAHAAGLANGHYAFVQLDHQVYPESHIINSVLGMGQWQHGHADDQIAREAYNYLIHIVLDPMNEDDTTPASRVPRNRHEEFARMATTVATVKKPEWQLPVGGKVDASSLYLYDSVLVWAVLVDKLQAAGSPTRDGLLLAQRAQAFMADGYVSINSQHARDGKTFVLTMAPGGNFAPVQRLKFAGNTEYAVLNIRPIDDRFRFVTKKSIPKPPSTSPLITTIMTTTAATTTTSTTTTPASTQPPLMQFPNKVPPPPNDAVSVLLARVQMLERKIKMHEAHSHDIIPNHTHTPAPILPHTHTIPYHTNTPPTVHEHHVARHNGPFFGPQQLASNMNPLIPQQPQNNSPLPSSHSVALQQQSTLINQPVNQPISVINQPPQLVNQPILAINQPQQPVNQHTPIIHQPQQPINQHIPVIHQPQQPVNQHIPVIYQPQQPGDQHVPVISQHQQSVNQHIPFIHQPEQPVNQNILAIHHPQQPVHQLRQSKQQFPNTGSRKIQYALQPNPPIMNADFNSGPIPRMVANPHVFNSPAQQYPQTQQWPNSQPQQNQQQQPQNQQHQQQQPQNQLLQQQQLQNRHNQQEQLQNRHNQQEQLQNRHNQQEQLQNLQVRQNKPTDLPINQASTSIQYQQQQQKQTQQQQHRNKTRTITIQTQTRQISPPQNNKNNQRGQKQQQNAKVNKQHSQKQSQQQVPGSQVNDAYLDKISARVVDRLTGRILGTENSTQSEQRRAITDLLANEENPASFFLGLTLAEQHARMNQQERQSQQGSSDTASTQSMGMNNDPFAAFLDPWGYIFGNNPSTTDPWASGPGPWWGEA
ncbi:ANPRC-like protein [Mya arenaria]|uniref:ANPRC-like protein n=1 Tax=Mya arenaria TaxID=6604 RepID=A0ABY7E4J0_MYAAR|nr:ANPRC-like protein [Mya arenaria]